MTTTHISELKPDQKNARRHTPRNVGMVEHSIQRDGFGRSILVAKDGTIIAGNATIEAAAAAGIENVVVVESDGKSIIAVKRTDVEPGSPEFHALALSDNRAAELASWDADVLASLADDGVDLSQFWFEDELAGVLAADDDDYLPGDTGDEDEAAEPRQTLADRFLVPPFSVLDARQGYWQDRKRAWLALGIKSELGRGENALGFSEGVNQWHDNGSGPYAKNSTGNGPARSFGQDLMRGEHTVGEGKRTQSQRLTYATGVERSDETSRKILAGGRKRDSRAIKDHAWQAEHLARPQAKTQAARVAGPGETGNAAEFDHYRVKEGTREVSEASGTSIFDPVLCELAYRWFSPPTGVVLDPFAGGSVRGIVAAKLGRSYIGIDLSRRQVEANFQQGGDIIPENCPVWHVGDSRDVRSIIGDQTADFVFSCPPYADLEVYSDHPADLSTMPYDEFLIAYRHIIAASIDRLANDRFACFVVGDVRDGKGIYRNFVSHTIQAFEDAGVRLYNEAILVTAVGSLPIRVGRQFEVGRKLGKTHQNVLIFVKGDPKKATAAIGPVDVADVFEEMAEAGMDVIGDDPAFAELAAARFAEEASDA